MNEERRIAELEEQVEKLSSDNRKLIEYVTSLSNQLKGLENALSKLYLEQFNKNNENSDTVFKNK